MAQCPKCARLLRRARAFFPGRCVRCQRRQHLYNWGLLGIRWRNLRAINRHEPWRVAWVFWLWLANVGFVRAVKRTDQVARTDDVEFVALLVVRAVLQERAQHWIVEPLFY